MSLKRIIWALFVVAAICLTSQITHTPWYSPSHVGGIALVAFFAFPRNKAAALEEMDPLYRFRWLRRRLRHYGVPADVTVVSTRTTNENVNGVPVTHITARLDSGEIIEFEDCFELVKTPAPDTRIHVNIDPKDHTKVILA